MIFVLFCLFEGGGGGGDFSMNVDENYCLKLTCKRNILNNLNYKDIGKDTVNGCLS